MKRAYMDHAAAMPVRPEAVHSVLAHLPPAVEIFRSFSPVWREKMAAGAGE